MITFKSQNILFSNAVLLSGKDVQENLSMMLSTYKAVPSGGEDVSDYLSVTLSMYS